MAFSPWVFYLLRIYLIYLININTTISQVPSDDIYRDENFLSIQRVEKIRCCGSYPLYLLCGNAIQMVPYLNIYCWVWIIVNWGAPTQGLYHAILLPEISWRSSNTPDTPDKPLHLSYPSQQRAQTLVGVPPRGISRFLPCRAGMGWCIFGRECAASAVVLVWWSYSVYSVLRRVLQRSSDIYIGW